MTARYEPITTEAQLEDLYGQAVQTSLDKVVSHVTPQYRRWIEASRFVVLASVGPEGTDLSPRGDIDAVVRIADERTLLLPDWLGNNRIDTLRNIVRDNRISLMFMVNGSNNVVRVNGTAIVTTDQELLASFERKGKHPRSVLVISIAELYFQCAKALMRSDLWAPPEEAPAVPTAGDFVKEVKAGFDGAAYDKQYPEHAEKRMW